MNILVLETLIPLDPEVRSIHYARYDKRKGNPKNDKSRSSTSKNEYSSSRNSDSTECTPLCYRCHKPFTKGHLQNCKAIDVECNYCRLKGHFKKCCKKAGNFPMNENSNKKNVHIATELGFYSTIQPFQGNFIHASNSGIIPIQIQNFKEFTFHNTFKCWNPILSRQLEFFPEEYDFIQKNYSMSRILLSSSILYKATGNLRFYTNANLEGNSN